MAISPQRLTIYLYSAHRAVIFAIAQLSCFELALQKNVKSRVFWILKNVKNVFSNYGYV